VVVVILQVRFYGFLGAGCTRETTLSSNAGVRASNIVHALKVILSLGKHTSLAALEILSIMDSCVATNSGI
jgi:hypothetical protein